MGPVLIDLQGFLAQLHTIGHSVKHFCCTFSLQLFLLPLEGPSMRFQRVLVQVHWHHTSVSILLDSLLLMSLSPYQQNLSLLQQV